MHSFAGLHTINTHLTTLLLTQHISHAAQLDGKVRLSEGRADSGGFWQYGRLEVLFSGVWSVVLEPADFQGFKQGIDQAGIQVQFTSSINEHPDKIWTGWHSRFGAIDSNGSYSWVLQLLLHADRIADTT